MNILRRLPLSRLLLLCALATAIGVSATELAFAIGAGPAPPSEPLADAVHNALAGANGKHIEGVSASITWTNHLLEGANLATGNGGAGGGASSPQGELTSSPLVTGASGRLWIADGHARVELQSQQGDTQILYDGHTLTVYDAANNTLYRYTPEGGEDDEPHEQSGQSPEVPSVAKIEEAIAHLSKRAYVSPATPTDIAGQPAYTVRVSPDESGSLFGGVELSFDADNGVPLRGAIYSSQSSSPVAELAASEVSFGPVESSVFELDPPANAKVEEVKLPHHEGQAAPDGAHGDEHAKVTTYGHGVSSVAIVESPRDQEAGANGSGSAKGAEEQLGDLPKVSIDGTSASELKTELGTLLSFERGGVRYLLAGAVAPAAIEAVARGL
jgi:outer membrane lipoprotein-sorting protein